MPRKKRNTRDYGKMPREKAWGQYQKDRLSQGGTGAKMAPKKRFMQIHFPKSRSY